MNPNFPQIHHYVGCALVHKKLYAEAANSFKERLLKHSLQQTMALLGYTYGVMGNKREALEILNSLNELSEQRYVSSYLKAIVSAGLEQIDEAFLHLEKALAERAAWMVFMKIDPFLDRMREDKRFEAILRRVGFSS